MSEFAYALVGLTVIVAALVGLLTFAVLRIGAAMRDMRGQLRASGHERVFMATALEDALARLRDQERTTAERAAASERLNTEIVNSLTAGLLVVGTDREVRIMNPAARRLLRLSPDAALADYRDMLAATPSLAAAIDECLATGRAIVRRALELPPSARPVTHLGVTVSPLVGDQGSTQGAICLFTDLTDIVALEEQLRLKDSLARLGELTAGLAHEFRNGLATIHGYARLMDPASLPPAYRPYLQGIRDETDSLGTIVTNFLSFARPAPLTVALVDLRSLLQRVAADARAERGARGGDIEMIGEFPTIEGDEGLLRQAIGNLVRNAFEACDRVPVVPRVVIEGSVDDTQHVARVTVSDNGPGIDAASRDQIFRPFYTTRHDGTGLGLAIVQKIAVMHNGRVSCSSEPGQGARFELTLPVSSSH